MEEAKGEIQREEQKLVIHQKVTDLSGRKQARKLEAHKNKKALDDLKRQSELALKLKLFEVMVKISYEGNVQFCFLSFEKNRNLKLAGLKQRLFWTTFRLGFQSSRCD